MAGVEPLLPASTTQTASTRIRRTLADVPVRFMRVEVDERNKQLPDEKCKTETLYAHRGRLADYFTNETGVGAWYGRASPREYQRDFPFSVDNVDYGQLLQDLSDFGGLPDPEVTLCSLWLHSLRDRGTGSTPVENGDGGEAYRVKGKRITSYSGLLARINCVRLSLQTGTESVPPIVFIVAVSYSRGGHSAGGMTLPAALSATTMSFLERLLLSPSRGPPHSSDDNTDSSSVETSSSLNSRSWGTSSDLGSEEDGAISGSDGGSDGSTRIGPGMLPHPPFPYIPDGHEEEHERERLRTLARFLDQVRAANAYRLPIHYSNSEADDEAEGAVAEGGTEAVSDASEAAPPEMPAAAVASRSIMETLDTNAAKGDPIEGDLHALLPDAQSPSEAEWQQCCALLCLDPEAHRDAQARSVKVPGTDNMWVKPSQLWTAYWMLTSRAGRGLCGGVLADVMGTGKTYVCLLLCLLRAYIGYNRAEVEREWQLREHEAKKGSGSSGSAAPKQHLPRDAGGGSSSYVPCTCGNAMGIECYANPGGVTRRLADSLSRGASLILAPQTVLDNWVKTVKAVRLQPKYYEPVVFHSKMNKEDAAMAPAPRLKQKLRMEVRPQPHVSSDRLFPADWEPMAEDAVFYEFHCSVAKDAFPERFIFLAAHAPEKLVEFFQVPVPLRRQAGARARKRKTAYACPIGMQIVDEFHKVRENDKMLALTRQHKHMQTSGPGGSDNFDFWAITGTPLPAKLTDLEEVTSTLQRLPEWDNPSHRHHQRRVVDLRALQAAYEQAVAEHGTPEQVAEFRTRAESFFQGGFIKRHTEASSFFGQLIFHLQDVAPKVIVHGTPERFCEDVSKVVARVRATIHKAMAASSSSSPAEKNWAQLVRSSSLFNHMMHLEVLATFPGAARLMLQDPPALDFGLVPIQNEIRNAEGHDATNAALFQKHLDTVIDGSPHLETILATLDEMSRDKQKRHLPAAAATTDAKQGSTALPPKKVDAGLKKLVILCPRMGEAVFVYLALCKLRPEAHAIFWQSGLTGRERTALLRDFNRLDAGPGSKTPRVLVGTFRDAGTGNDLTVASYQILTGPLRLRSQQDQAFGRTNREGQTLALHQRLLVTEDSPVDRLIMATQARRRIVSDPFAMDEPLQLEKLEDEHEK